MPERSLEDEQQKAIHKNKFEVFNGNAGTPILDRLYPFQPLIRLLQGVKCFVTSTIGSLIGLQGFALTTDTGGWGN
jgi:hypothetical protein